MTVIKRMFAGLLVLGSAVFAIMIIFQNPSKPSLKNKVFEYESLPTQSPVSANDYNKTFQDISKAIATELAKANPQGPTVIDGQEGVATVEPEKVADIILAQGFQSVDLKDFDPDVLLSDLKIIKTGDKLLAENYLKNFRAILEKNFSVSGIDFQNPKAENWRSLAKIYQKAIDQFYSLNVPENLATLHQRQIKLMTIQKNIFESLANYENDPFKAFIAASALKETENQLQALSKNFADVAQKNGLSI